MKPPSLPLTLNLNGFARSRLGFAFRDNSDAALVGTLPARLTGPTEPGVSSSPIASSLP